MNAKISWIRLLISCAGVAGAALFFWKASQVGLSNEKILYTVLAVACAVLAFLSFIFSKTRSGSSS
jgi:hypothetical protein